MARNGQFRAEGLRLRVRGFRIATAASSSKQQQYEGHVRVYVHLSLVLLQRAEHGAKAYLWLGAIILVQVCCGSSERQSLSLSHCCCVRAYKAAALLPEGFRV